MQSIAKIAFQPEITQKNANQQKIVFIIIHVITVRSVQRDLPIKNLLPMIVECQMLHFLVQRYRRSTLLPAQAGVHTLKIERRMLCF